MTLYLQRLLNRSAGAVLPAGPPAAALHPALQSASPIVSFDQRLADPEAAANFGLVGASLPEAPLPEPAIDPWPDLAPARSAQDGPAPLAPPPPEAPVAPVSTEASLEFEAAPETVPQAPPRVRRRTRGDAPATAEAAVEERAQPADRPAPRISHVTATPIVEKVAGPAEPAPAQIAAKPQRGTARADAPPISPPAARAEPTPEPVTAPTANRSRTEAPTASPVADRRGPPRTTEPASVARAAPAAAPEPAAAMARPVVAAPPPIEPAPAPFALRDIERIVEDKLRCRLANQSPAVPPTLQAAAGDAAAQAAPARKRPATAAEASLIGKLDSSAYQPMLFGVRRR